MVPPSFAASSKRDLVALRVNGRSRRWFERANDAAPFPRRLRRGFGRHPATASHQPAALCVLMNAYIVSVTVVGGYYISLADDVQCSA